MPRPLPGDHDVLVRVSAAGLGRGAWHVMTGVPYLSRLIFGVRRPKNPVLGTEVAGTRLRLALTHGRPDSRYTPNEALRRFRDLR